MNIFAENGCYITAELGGGIDSRQPDSPPAVTARGKPGEPDANGPWQQWTQIRNDDGTVSYTCYDGHYLTAELGGGSTLSTDRDENGPWQRFTRIQGRLRCVDGLHFLGVQAGSTTMDAIQTANTISWPQAPVMPQLRVQGLDLIDETGQRVVLSGLDGFLDFFIYRRQGADALIPLLEEARSLKANLRRVHLAGSLKQNTLFDLSPLEAGFYEDLPPFVELLNSYGQILLANVNVDMQDVMPLADARQRNWIRVTDILRGSGTIASKGNQWEKNGYNPYEMSAPNPGILWSQGSNVEDKVVQPRGAPIQEFHPRRDLPASLMDTVASSTFIYQSGSDWDRPLIISEPPKMGLNGSAGFDQPRRCWEFARHYSTECAGAVFHSYEGQRSQPLGLVTRACVDAWQQGIRI